MKVVKEASIHDFARLEFYPCRCELVFKNLKINLPILSFYDIIANVMATQGAKAPATMVSISLSRNIQVSKLETLWRI